MKIRKREALEYHERQPHGKVAMVATKPCLTQRDLSLAYTPGVAVPCREIEHKAEDAYRFTSKGNLVAVMDVLQLLLALQSMLLQCFMIWRLELTLPHPIFFR